MNGWIGFLLYLMVTSPVSAQIDGLYFCGMSKTTGEIRCFDSLALCRTFDIHGTCRAERQRDLPFNPWCLYQGKSVLWGCYSKQEVCESKLSGLRNSKCFELK